MDCGSKFRHGRLRSKVLCRGIHQVDVRVIVHDRGINVRHEHYDGKERQNNDIELLFEEHAEHGLPIGISRRRDLLCADAVKRDSGEEFFVRIARKKLALFCFFFLFFRYLFCHNHLPVLRRKRDSRIHECHEYVTHDQGYDTQGCVKERYANDDAVIVLIDGGGK